MMFGIVLAVVKVSARTPTPRAALISMSRTTPVMRETIVPTAMPPLERRTPACTPGDAVGVGRGLGAGLRVLLRTDGAGDALVAHGSRLPLSAARAARIRRATRSATAIARSTSAPPTTMRATCP